MGQVGHNSWEVRGKTLGIVGYGNIGAQLSVLAEALGMHVLFYDPAPEPPLGTCASRAQPGRPFGRARTSSRCTCPNAKATRLMIGAAQFRAMRPGALPHQRLARPGGRCRSAGRRHHGGHLLGAAVDVFPRAFSAHRSSLAVARPAKCHPDPAYRRLDRRGAGTIGSEVARKLADYSDIGSTFGAVNFPQVQLPARLSGTRFMHVHRNTPGMLARASTSSAAGAWTSRRSTCRLTVSSATS